MKVEISFQAEYHTDKPKRKRSNGKMCTKRVRSGGSRAAAVPQMDFQGRGEPAAAAVSRPGLSRYRKKNVMAFAERTYSMSIQVVPQIRN